MWKRVPCPKSPHFGILTYIPGMGNWGNPGQGQQQPAQGQNGQQQGGFNMGNWNMGGQQQGDGLASSATAL